MRTLCGICFSEELWEEAHPTLDKCLWTAEDMQVLRERMKTVAWICVWLQPGSGGQGIWLSYCLMPNETVHCQEDESYLSQQVLFFKLLTHLFTMIPSLWDFRNNRLLSSTCHLNSSTGKQDFQAFSSSSFPTFAWASYLEMILK